MTHEIIKPARKKRPSGSARSWMSGFSTALLICSLSFGWAMYHGNISRTIPADSEGGYQEADYISAAEALKPVKLSRGR